MDAVSQITQPEGFNVSSLAFYAAIALVIAGVVGAVLYFVVFKAETIPGIAKDAFMNKKKEGFTDKKKEGFLNGFSLPGVKSSGANAPEGFQGPTRGVSAIPCGQESREAIDLVEMLDKKSTTEEGNPDRSEFYLILSKLLCLKHDLVSTAQVVQATTYLPYRNTHDRLNPADVAARCFTKSIPPRDLDISFDTWKQRAIVLISRICTSYGLTSAEAEKAKGLFESIHRDVYSIAQGVCIPPTKAPEYGSPRDPKPFADPSEEEQGGPYTGYY
jgi:hypothetical protein